MTRPAYDEPPHLWEVDGSFRDVYVHDVSSEDWSALHALIGRYPYRYSFEGAAESLPDARSIFAKREGTHLVAIAIGAASLNCHYFELSEIELDIDPREVRTAETHFAVLRFIEELAHATGKVVSVTAENAPGAVLLRFQPKSGTWTVFAAAAEAAAELPGKSTHQHVGGDDAEIERLIQDAQRPSNPKASS